MKKEKAASAEPAKSKPAPKPAAKAPEKKAAKAGGAADEETKSVKVKKEFDLPGQTRETPPEVSMRVCGSCPGEYLALARPSLGLACPVCAAYP